MTMASPVRGLGIADVSVDRPVFALMMSLALVVVGTMSYLRLGVDLLPEVERPQVTVFTTLPGAAPQEIESAITQPIEERLNTIAGIEEMRSVNRDGFSFVILTFNLERPVAEALQDVRDKLAGLARVFPEGTEPPEISTFDSESTPVLSVVVSGPLSLRELTEYAETRVKDVLATAAGVGAVTVEGGRRRAINVVVDADRLVALRLGILDVRAALEAGNVEMPGGRVTRENREDVLRTMARVNSVSELEDLVVARRMAADGRVGQVLLRDVARVEDGTVEVRGTSRWNGTPAVTLSVQKQSGANIVATAQAVKKRVDMLRATLPAGMNLLVIRDASVFVEESVAEARFHLVGGAFLAALAVLVFMGSWRSTLIAAVAIPASIVATFSVMRAFGFTLNNITLLALTLSVGVVIDDAIVVVENIHRRMGKDALSPIEAAKLATREIALAVTATTLSLVVIFLPVAFMTGQVGRLFHSYGITVAAAVLISLFVAFTLTPMLASRFLQAPRAGASLSPLEHWAMKIMHPLEHAYARAVDWSLRHRALMLLVSLLIVLSTVPLFRAARSDFIPEDDQSEFEVSIEMPTGTSFQASDEIVASVEREIARLPGVTGVLASVGDARGTGSATRATLYVALSPIHARQQTQADVMQQARKVLSRAPDLRVTVRSLNNTGLGGGGYGGSLRIAIRGPDLQKLEDILRRLLKEMRADPAFVDVFSPAVDRLPEMRVIPDRQKAAELGLSSRELAETLRVLVGGDKIGSFREGDERYDVVLRAELDDRNSLEAIGRLPLSTKSGLVSVQSVAQVEEALGPVLILRLNGVRQVFLSGNPSPTTTLGAAVDRARVILDGLNVPPGIDTLFIGDAKTLEEARREFGLALLLSLVFVYMVLAAQFESLLHPITILLVIPLTAPFALVSLLVMGESINVYSIFGMFMLFGIVKKNGILQVDTTNQLVSSGMDVHQAIVEANRMRLRPILMTTLTLVAAMAPMTVARGPGAASRAALARVIVGGQALSLLITLLIVPVAWSLFHDAQKRFAKRREGTSKDAMA
jgi:HAE1 family hydrophobic/amphiphilic exporter-1